MAKDLVRNSINLILAVGGFAAKPGLLSGLKTGVSVCDTITKMAAAPPPALSRLAKDLTASARSTFDSTPHLPEGAELLFSQMVKFGLPDAREIVAANLRPNAICDAMLAKLDQIEHTRPPMPMLFRNVTLPVLEAVLAEKSFADDLMPAWMAEVSGSLAQIQQVVEHLKRQSDSTARKLGIQEGLLIALARRYAEGDPEDFDSALAGLEHALETAAEELEKGRLPGNVSDAVDAIVERVDALNAAGEIDAAEAALVAELERQEAAQARLINKGIAQAFLTRNVALAARLEVKRLALDGGGFDALRAVRDVWYERGRDKGLRFDLEVAIKLAEESLHRAVGPDQRGTALNDLGLALATLGEREGSTDRLHAAVAAFTEALKEYTRERVPLDWAMTQMNLGNALRTLGARESGTDRLHAAVAAFTEALKEYTRERVPLDWAMTQNNLGTALKTLGERESGTDRLQAAVIAYTEALKERTRARVPLHWATTQNNLGSALATLGERESGTDRLHAAVTAYTEALKEYTRERVPLDWAMTQMNLGAALQTLGARESGTDRLHAAIATYTEALKEYTRARVPLDWAATQNNLCNVALAFFAKTGGAAHLDRAQGHLDAAREVFEAAQASHYLQIADRQQAEIDARRASLRKS